MHNQVCLPGRRRRSGPTPFGSNSNVCDNPDTAEQGVLHGHRRRPLGRGLLVTSALRAGAAPTADQLARPNILIIYTDDQRWDSLSLAGHPFLKTPNIDRIGREGAVFDNSFVTSPLCSPSRASLLTGQYAHTHRVRTNEGAEEISFNLETFLKILKQTG